MRKNYSKYLLVIKTGKREVVENFCRHFEAIWDVVFPPNGDGGKGDVLNWIIRSLDRYQNWVGIPI
jgi:hypothetical protein